jgi:hypothetical protein
LPGFIVYPPEISKEERPDGSFSSVIIKYAIIPKEQGPVIFDLSFSVFETNTEKYITTVYHKKFVVEKGNNHTAVIDDAAENMTVQEMQSQAKMKNRARQGILSLKNTDSDDKVLLPLIRNHSFMIYFLLFVGPLIFIFFELYKRYHLKLNDNPELRRLKNAKRNKRKIKALLKNCRGEDLNEVVKNEVIPFLNDLYGFAPGTSVNEIADKIDDKELEMIHQLDLALIENVTEVETAIARLSSDMDSKELKSCVKAAVKAITDLTLKFEERDNIVSGVA